MDTLNIEENRAGQKYTLSVQLMRVAWGFGRMLFRVIPRPFYGLRRFILKCFGARLGRRVNVANTATIYFPWNLEVGDWSSIGERAMIYNLGKITIGKQATISQGVHLCAGSHDYLDPAMPLLTLPITIGDQVWICADAFIGPNVVVGEAAVVGARAVACKDVNSWSVVAGNPAVEVRSRSLRKKP
ncbi:MAG: hypothetical protein V5783_05920 [Pontiella sp.]